MKKIIGLFTLSLLVLSILFPIISASDSGITTEEQAIVMSISDKGLDVEESVLVKNIGHQNATSIRFWIQQGVQDVEILAVESGEYLNPILSGNVRNCNLSEYNLTIEPDSSFDFRVTYTLPTGAENFEKTLQYDTTYLSITYEDNTLYQVQEAQSESSFSLQLYRPTEAPLTISYIVIIFILVVILIASTLVLLRKQRSKAKNSIIESEETLITKKTLLLSLLKDLEKQHRSEDISDDTYNKLKDEYKSQAVDVMKKLDDLKK